MMAKRRPCGLTKEELQKRAELQSKAKNGDEAAEKEWRKLIEDCNNETRGEKRAEQAALRKAGDRAAIERLEKVDRLQLNRLQRIFGIAVNVSPALGSSQPERVCDLDAAGAEQQTEADTVRDGHVKDHNPMPAQVDEASAPNVSIKQSVKLVSG